MVFSRPNDPPVQAECRYCLESDKQTNLLAPCICKGSFQFVHETCLRKWYVASPDKGLQCSACGTMLARKFSHELEDNPVQFPWMGVCLQNPMVIIGYVHACFLLLYILTLQTTIEPHFLYTLVQYIFHGMQIGKLIALVSHVHHQSLYWKLWLNNRRILLPIVHIYLLYIFEYAYLLGGISADICMCIYFYEHLSIIQLLNDKRTFVFTNHTLFQN